MRRVARIALPCLLFALLAGMDTDGDGMSDERERELGTDPAHNGIIDFPEPMIFDMVRGLGAEQGEVEFNTLVQLPADPFEVVWAPELEAAVIDAFAIEVEAGFIDSDFAGIKLGLQPTLAMREDASMAHGLLGLVEYLPDLDVVETSLSYVLGARLAPGVSVVAIVGPALESHVGGRTEVGAVINATLFWAPSPRWVIGSEQNALVFADAHLFRWMPEVHHQLNHRFQIQAGLGYLLVDRGSSLEGALRLIAEF